MCSRDNALCQAEFNELLAVCRDGKDKILIILCVLGMRVGEASQLNVSWIDWQALTVRISVKNLK